MPSRVRSAAASNSAISGGQRCGGNSKKSSASTLTWRSSSPSREPLHVGGRPGHEIVHVFAVASPQLDDLTIDGELAVLDNHTTVRWVELDELRAGDPPFYPVGMADFAARLGTPPTRRAGNPRSDRLDRLETWFSGIPFPHTTIGMPRRARRPAGKAIRP